MPEPWRTVLEVLLTAFFGLNIVMLKSLLGRMNKLEDGLQKHEISQAATMLRIDTEMTGIRGNYVDRFSEVNKNISGVKEELNENVFEMKEQVMGELSNIKVAIAKLQTYNEKG